MLGLVASAILIMSGHAASATPTKPPAVKVVLKRKGGEWIVDYSFRKSAPVWFFQHSKDSIDRVHWRLASWKVETPGVKLVRLGQFDALYRTDNRSLRDVRFRIVPFSRPLRSDYAPALTFSDSGLAFYSHHFVVSPLNSTAAVEALPSDPDWENIEDAPATLTMKDLGHRMLLRGRISRNTVTLSLAEADTYIYSGPAPLLSTEHFAEVMDPSLPTWIRSQLDLFLPRLMAFYTNKLGAPSGTRPTALIAWEGAERPGVSLGGSVMDGLVVMALSGKQMIATNSEVLTSLRWFFAHETSHFWVGQTVHYSRSEEGWIMEGSADLIGIRAMQQIVPGYDPAPKLQQEMNDCIKLNGAGKPLSTAESRGDYKAQYACGALLLLVAEAASKQKDTSSDAFSFIRQLIDANRSDGEVTEAEWLAMFSQAAGPVVSREVQAFIDDGVPDPLAFWARIFTATGIRYTRKETTLSLVRPKEGA
ncbi:MAG: hypothetical protein EOP69_00820 [Spirochaetia bacterium]|nr:MAG: hypothetical protein EOP69_00820 [Spirochaetia bacterium]